MALTVDESFSAWCSRTLPRLAPGLSLVTVIPGGAVRRCLEDANLPERTVAVVLAPQLTTAVRRSFSRPAFLGKALSKGLLPWPRLDL